ncbi:hypothetical protein [Tepidibacter hydrothermalis]|uniref:Uncharacterized protein n=1 Tax=Tepidibacter hydrothermalis TaxID=3036126 RepID=A0ABY8ELA8_9FIRM|nr:hypothetical protein [Tepidibacter hydrothermalis]WFD12225.1 hypothetical protein P4S50_09110 [Tepidibacter hydrothermalis]
MKPVKTDTSNITFVGEGCEDLPGTRYMCDDGVTPGIETVWELSEEEKQQVLESGRIYLYIMGRTVQPCFLATESAIRMDEEPEISQEDLKYLKDAAEQESVERLTNAQIKVEKDGEDNENHESKEQN